MSLATLETRAPRFLHRFEHLRSSLRRFQILEGLAWSSLTATIGLAALVMADYWLELPTTARAAGLAIAATASLAVLLARVILPMRWWTRPRTAAEIEGRFPQLGQRIRTVVQYAVLDPDEIHAEGATPSLVDALEDETEAQAEPLPLDRIVPWWRARTVAVLAAIPLIALLVAAAFGPEWRIAFCRAFLSGRAYTRLTIAPGDVMVDQGADVPIVAGAGRPVATRGGPLHSTRSTDRCALAGDRDDDPDQATAPRRESKLEKVEAPLVYRVVAGSATSPTYRIDVRYPLELKAFDVDLKPPAYTGIRPSTVKGGDLRVIERTEVTFRIAFDAPPASASLVLTDPSAGSKKDKKAPRRRSSP